MKGLVYTALGAAAAAVLIGTVLTPEKRSQLLKYAKDNSGPLLDKAKNLISSLSNQPSTGGSAYDQANKAGHA
jgi:hypothetical protein